MYALSHEDKSIVRSLGNLLSHDLETIAAIDRKTRNILEIGDSQIHGTGYKALRDIVMGESIMSAFGILIGHQTEQHSIQQSMGVHIEPFEMGGKYLNHSCDGNLYVNSDDRGIAFYYAKMDIGKGEEINYHFGLTEFKWQDTASEIDLDCNCNTSKCEGVIKSFSMLTEDKQREFVEENIVSKYLVDWFKAQKDYMQ
jgi:hypothetical protein